MSTEDKFYQLLDELGAVLIRDNNHKIYRLRNGAIFTTSKTPSDHRAWAKMYSSLRHVGGVLPEKKDPPPVSEKRKETHRTPQRSARPTQITTVLSHVSGPARDLRSQLASLQISQESRS